MKKILEVHLFNFKILCKYLTVKFLKFIRKKEIQNVDQLKSKLKQTY